MVQDEPTFFGNHGHDCILVYEAHAGSCPFANTCDCIRAPHSSLAVCRRVKQSALEVSIELRVELTIVAEHDTNSFVRVDCADFQVSSKGMLLKVAVVRGYL
jgi:hypothetical protein